MALEADARKTDNKEALFSIIVATFNVADTLADTIDSVLAQGRTDVELIIVDGNSSDGTVELIRSYGDRVAWWISEPDNGIYNAWNKGLRAATGRYLSFVGADDVMLPGALNSYARLAAASPEAEFLSARVQYGDHQNARIIGRPWDWHKFRHYMTVAHVGSMHRRTLFDRIGAYDESFAITGDYELLLRAGANLKTAYMSEITMRMGVDGISSGRGAKVFDEAARAKTMHSGLPRYAIAVDRWRAIAGYRLRNLLGV